MQKTPYDTKKVKFDEGMEQQQQQQQQQKILCSLIMVCLGCQYILSEEIVRYLRFNRCVARHREDNDPVPEMNNFVWGILFRHLSPFSV